MVSLFLVAGLSLIAVWACIQLNALRHNIAKAKQSGLPYVLSPVYFQSIGWLVLQEPLAPLLNILPESWTKYWLPLSRFGRVWHEGYKPFSQIKSDNVVLVSPSGNILWTCDPEAIQQFSKRNHDFVKPVEMMGMLNLYGPTVTATEGEESRTYRKIAAPSFNDRTHGAVWNESLNSSLSLLKRWENMDAPIEQLNDDVARLTLHVISSVCYNRPVEAPSATGSKASLSKGHCMSYSEAISSMVENIPILFMVPPAVLNFSPFSAHKKAKESYIEWQRYMENMRDETSESLRINGSRTEVSLLESFVQAGQSSIRDSKIPPIAPAAVLGNIFVFLMAGYETSANTLTFAMTLLACRPDLQRHLQADLDRILGDRPTNNWSYQADFPQLLDGYLGAVLCETLRLYSILPFVPKTTKEKPQPFSSNGREYIVPADTLILMDTSAAHRNPKYWPEAVSRGNDGLPFPVSSFDPARWLTKRNSVSAFSPVAGSFIPFSDGPRTCMGKRFAQAEICAVMAALYKNYSIELAVKDDERDYQERWQEARQEAEKGLSTGVGFLMSLKMTRDVPLRLVRRSRQ